MTAYVMIRIKTDDPASLKNYQAVAPAIVEKYQGQFLVRGGEVITFEGAEETRRIVMIAFPNLEQAKAFYTSDEYTQAIEYRKDVAEFEICALEGIA